MCWLNLIFALFAVLFMSAISDPCPCNDNPPAATPGLPQYSCAQQIAYGKCSERWMEGYCQCACGVCAYDDDAFDEDMDDMDSKPKKVKKGKKGKKNRKAMEDDDDDDDDDDDTLAED